eukprot:Polyplicarium_translucidae@DN2983_c0_g1_i1.p1
MEPCLAISGTIIDSCNRNYAAAGQDAVEWAIFSTSLLHRSRAEQSSSKKADRAALQLQCLVDQFGNASPSARHRLRRIFHVPFPPLWELRALGARRLRSVGALVSAAEIFEDLQMWEEAADCLVVAQRRDQAMCLLQSRLAASPTPHLWCTLGDLENGNLEHYATAWETSKHRYARAQRSTGHLLMKRGEFEAAATAYDKALAINPLHSNCWFALGCAHLRCKKYHEAATAFGRVACQDPDNADAWANLAAAHSQCEHWREAKHAINEAAKRNRTSWKIWQSYASISVAVDDGDGIIYALEQICAIGESDKVVAPLLHAATSVAASQSAARLPETRGKVAMRLLDLHDRVAATSAHEKLQADCLLDLARMVGGELSLWKRSATMALKAFSRAEGSEGQLEALRCFVSSIGKGLELGDESLKRIGREFAFDVGRRFKADAEIAEEVAGLLTEMEALCA